MSTTPKPVPAAAVVVTWAKLGPFQAVSAPVAVRLVPVQVVDFYARRKAP